MKTKVVILFSLLFIGLSSCVSLKKYKTLNEQKAEKDKMYKDLQANYQQLKAENENLAEQSSTIISEKNKTIEEKEMDLLTKEQRIEQLNAILEAQQKYISDLRAEITDALKSFNTDELYLYEKDGKLYVSLSEKLLFPSGSDVVNDRGKEAISAISGVIFNSDIEIIVEGHTDNVPIASKNYEDNWDLSVNRATSVVRYFTENGIKPERLIACGRGEFHPVATNETIEGKAKNRRTEIILAPNLNKLWKLTAAK